MSELRSNPKIQVHIDGQSVEQSYEEAARLFRGEGATGFGHLHMIAIFDNIAKLMFNILALLTILDKMVQIGKIVKYDDYGRISCPSALAELLDLQKGKDEVTWHVEDGIAILRKVTKTYAGGFDFESDEIEKRLREYEEQYCEPGAGEELDYEEAQARARAQYEKDKEAKSALKEEKKRSHSSHREHA